jgi:predicted Ser/Thr protein kinase
MPNRKKKKNIETLSELELRGRKLEAMINLSDSMRDTEKRDYMHFNDFLHMASEEPELIFRDIFQYVHDMMHHYVPEGVDEYGDNEHSVGFVHYDFSKLFVENCDDPFFADRLFANRLMNLANEFKKGLQNNHIYLFEGPPGSGKSTFLNNLLQKVEEYNKIKEGFFYKSVWRLDIKKLGDFHTRELEKLEALQNAEQTDKKDNGKRFLDITCPSNDHPILQIPKEYRADFLNELIPDKNFKKKILNSKEYRWVLKDKPCSICSSIYNILLDRLGEPLEVFNMLHARNISFDRQFGRGISIFNPGDAHYTEPIKDPTLQNLLNSLLKSDEVRYVYSHLANTNNGLYALMDIKENNIKRLVDLHGIISDGVHKVELAEERIKSLFVGLVNPEDKKNYENIKSFQDRITHINIPYVLDYDTEVSIYYNKFGEEIKKKFLPSVLENFGKIIVASRMERESPTINEWISDKDDYSKYVDDNMLLLKMELYKGIIPEWLSEEDTKSFNKEVRKDLIEESEKEGLKGISGRQALSVFNTFYSKYAKDDKLITMEMLKDFFIENEKLNDLVPEGLIDSLVDMYDYDVLQEVKESIYYYSEKQITRDILNYLFAINFEVGASENSIYTGDTIEITEEYFKNFEALFLGSLSTADERSEFRKDIHNDYVTYTLSYEVKLLKKDIKETKLFASLFEKYTRNLKENALTNYSQNDNFRRALMDFNTTGFNSYDNPTKETIKRMIINLKCKFEYTIDGAKQVALYVLDKKLDKKY